MALRRLGNAIGGWIRNSNLVMNVDPMNEAAAMNYQDSLANASMALNQSIRHQADVASRNEIQRELGEAPTSIPTGDSWDGPWEPVSNFNQIYADELLARQLDQDEQQPGASGADMVDPASQRARSNGLSNHPVDDNAKWNAALLSGSMNKNRRVNGHQTPSWAVPRGPTTAAVARTAIRQEPRAGASTASPFDLTGPSPVQATALSFSSATTLNTLAGTLFRLALAQLGRRMRTDKTDTLASELLMELQVNASFWTRTVQVWVDSMDGAATANPDAETLDDLVGFLMQAYAARKANK
jgi:hypothetical protein